MRSKWKPLWWRRKIDLPLFILKKRTHPVVWFLLFCVSVFILPLALAFKIELAGSVSFLLQQFISGPTHHWQLLAAAGIIAIYGSLFMFFANGAFVFLRIMAGYSARRNSSIAKWLYYKVRARYCDKK